MHSKTRPVKKSLQIKKYSLVLKLWKFIKNRGFFGPQCVNRSYFRSSWIFLMWLVVVGNWCLLLVSTLCIICLNSGCLVKKQPRISNISYSKGQVSYGYIFHLFQRRFPVMAGSKHSNTINSSSGFQIICLIAWLKPEICIWKTNKAN